ncbi:putative pyruvate dehydrogenase [Hibiscus syriacus]|uniref:Pyruvate dehydrogenase n=1 Tax=Hibiscus syriacus TaxID=106335 RepID=A0A6A2YH51_HIBSY|nr:uncharacterized protein LOC120165301 [Hibiscus syriacus]KAE8676879.1 putative pyruvate dehydrogenase [Hibiscus syriacus]
MGNCVLKSFGEVKEMVKVVTPGGGIMELSPPITAYSITKEFPGQAIYRTPHRLSQPLVRHENLHAGNLYYLLPRNNSKINKNNNNLITPASSSSSSSPYRMSFDQQRVLKRTDTGVAPAPPTVWKVKLVISPDKLAEILAQEAPTEALIESVRTVAKCGNGVSSSASNSDRWSVVSSCKGSIEK